MAPLEILASLHDAFVHLLHALLRRSPRAFLAILERAHGRLPHGTVHERLVQFEIPALVHRAHRRPVDMFLTIDADRRVELVIVIEFQDSVDMTKLWIWPQIATTAAAEFRAEAALLVFAISPDVRRWVRDLIPKLAVHVELVGAECVDLIQSFDDARERPLEALVGGLYHSRAITTAPKDRLAGIRAALIALTRLDTIDEQRYGVLVSLAVPKSLIEQASRELRDAGELAPEELEKFDHFIRSSYAFGFGHDEGLEEGRRSGLEEGRRSGLEEGRRSGLEEGRHSGLEEGRRSGLEEGRRSGLEEGRRIQLCRAVVDIASLRGIVLSGAQRETIDACEDLARLEQLYAQFMTADSSVIARSIAEL